MRPIVVVLLAAAAFGGWRWHQDRATDPMAAFASTTASPNGFVSAAMPEGIGRNVVLVLAPPNCPSDQAVRADALVQALSRAGVPVQRGSGFSFDVANPDAAQVAAMDRSVAVFRQGAPAVFVNGMAMSNPSPEQAIAEYRRTRG